MWAFIPRSMSPSVATVSWSAASNAIRQASGTALRPPSLPVVVRGEVEVGEDGVEMVEVLHVAEAAGALGRDCLGHAEVHQRERRLVAALRGEHGRRRRVISATTAAMHAGDPTPQALVEVAAAAAGIVLISAFQARLRWRAAAGARPPGRSRRARARRRGSSERSGG